MTRRRPWNIDSTLPFIKRNGVQLLAATYASSAAAVDGIADGLITFYRDKYPDVLQTRHAAVASAIAALQAIYRENFFPLMKARWDVYPDNIGHLIFSGCYRCHDDQHKSADGKTITKNCTACHNILAQGRPAQPAFSTEPSGLAFQHPEDIGDVWQQMPCSDCHTGATP